MIRAKLLNEPVDYTVNDAPMRPPILCPGCPHRSTFSVLKKLKIHACGDIGCSVLSELLHRLTLLTQRSAWAQVYLRFMVWKKQRGSEYIKNWVATIGDSTFLHTGINSLMNMVYNKSHGTVLILDNSTTGMTGHQEHAATGLTLKNERNICNQYIRIVQSYWSR